MAIWVILTILAVIGLFLGITNLVYVFNQNKLYDEAQKRRHKSRRGNISLYKNYFPKRNESGGE